MSDQILHNTWNYDLWWLTQLEKALKSADILPNDEFVVKAKIEEMTDGFTGDSQTIIVIECLSGQQYSIQVEHSLVD